MNFKISIIIPCYNAEKWIKQCVLSALNQDYGDVEVIAVDNESEDSTHAILKDLKKENKNLIISSAKNIYPNCWDEARLEGFKLATGDYLFTLASDDHLSPSYVTNCMEYISLAPDKILAFQSPIRSIEGKEEKYLGDHHHFYRSIEEFKKMVIESCPVNSPTVVYSRKLYDEGLLKTDPEKYGGAADYDLYCSLASKNILIYPSNQWLGYYYRWHEEQATWNVKKEGINYDKMIQDYWSKEWKT